MDFVAQKNIETYNLKKETEYMYKKSHLIRGGLAMEMILNSIPKKVGKFRVLSVACSTGLYEKVLVDKGIEVHGIDGAKKALLEAKANGLITKIGDVTKKLPYTDSYFDCVFAGEIIEHVFLVKPFLEDLARVLKPGGILVITTPNLARLEDRVNFLVGKSPSQIAPNHPYLYLHIRHFTYQTLKQSLEDCGFVIEEFQTNIVKLNLGVFKIKSRILSRVLPGLGQSLILKTVKPR